MDTVSHACFSYVVCRATGVAHTPRLGFLAACISMLPDLDFLIIPFLTEVLQFGFHRGPSHSLFMAAFMGILIGRLIQKPLQLSWMHAGGLVSLAWLGHIALDTCTGFGVALWWPLTHARVSADLVFVVDPLATLPLFLAILWDVHSSKTDAPRRIPALLGFIVFSGYLLSAYAIRSHLVREIRLRLQEQGMRVHAIHAEPTPFNHQLWYFSAQTEKDFFITYRSIWDGDQWEIWREIPKVQSPLQTFADHPLLPKMATVLEDGFTCELQTPDHLEVIDLRLGKRYGWQEEDAPFLFVYEVNRTASGGLSWKMEKPKNTYNYGRLSALFSRIAGHIPPTRLSSQPLR